MKSGEEWCEVMPCKERIVIPVNIVSQWSAKTYSSLRTPLMRLQCPLPWSCPQERGGRGKISACLFPFSCWSFADAHPLYIWVTSPNHQQLLRKLYPVLHSRASSQFKYGKWPERRCQSTSWKRKEKGQGILKRQTRFMSNAVISQGNLYVWVCLSAHYSIPLVCLSSTVTLILFKYHSFKIDCMSGNSQ